jgi:hypothetical protein
MNAHSINNNENLELQSMSYNIKNIINILQDYSIDYHMIFITEKETTNLKLQYITNMLTKLNNKYQIILLSRQRSAIFTEDINNAKAGKNISIRTIMTLLDNEDTQKMNEYVQIKLKNIKIDYTINVPDIFIISVYTQLLSLLETIINYKQELTMIKNTQDDIMSKIKFISASYNILLKICIPVSKNIYMIFQKLIN